MGYVRTKQIKGHRYAYWVSASWTARGPRQAVKAYLGKVLTLPPVKNVALCALITSPYDQTLSSLPLRDAITRLLNWTLQNHGFTQDGATLYHPSGLQFSLFKLTFTSSAGKPRKIALKLHEGFFCDKTIQELLLFHEQGFDRDVGIKLAKAFVQAGIDIPKDFFIAYFNRYMDDFVERGY